MINNLRLFAVLILSIFAGVSDNANSQTLICREAMKTEFVSTGAQLVGSALEAEMMVGSWFVPDEVDVATAGLTLAGKPLKQLYKVGKTLKASAEVANRINRVRDKLAGAVPAIRKKLGHSNFVIVMKRKKYRVSRKGHVGPNGQLEPAPMGELKDQEDELCRIPGGACFVKGTLVSTQHGLRAIETLNAKDLVWSRDAATGTTQLKPIVQTFEKYATTLALTFSNGETVETTREHPFYVESQGFVNAGELGIGTSIVTRAGPSVRLVSLKAGEAQTVYNFEVEDYHTYFVGQGEVWVHNADYDPAARLSELMRVVAASGKTADEMAQMLIDGVALICVTFDRQNELPGHVFLGKKPAGGGQAPLLYIDENGVVWKGGDKAIIRFPPGQETIDTSRLSRMN